MPLSRSRCPGASAQLPTIPTQQRLQRLADSVPVLLAYLGSDGRYQFANRLHEKWFGIARERIAGRSLLEVLGPEWRESIAQPLAQALAGQAVSLDHEPGDAGRPPRPGVAGARSRRRGRAWRVLRRRQRHCPGAGTASADPGAGPAACGTRCHG